MKPFCKWAGGKSQLLDQLDLRKPEDFEGYFEPFVGAGAVLFHFAEEGAVINDINVQLINTYMMIRDHCVELMELIDFLDKKIKGDAPKDFYYECRNRYNEKLTKEEQDVEQAALFIFLNKHCFNGLYRVNSRGLFNVPFNNSQADSYDARNLSLISEYLKKIEIKTGDFERAVQSAQSGDFVFLDSPYVLLNANSFEAYSKEGFSREDHERLAQLFVELDKRGCYCMLTNHNTDLIRSLYKNFDIDTVPVKRMISSKASARTGEEVIIRNY